MEIKRVDVGFGKYQWFIDEKEDLRDESEIWEWLKSIGKDKEAMSQLNYFGSIHIVNSQAKTDKPQFEDYRARQRREK